MDMHGPSSDAASSQATSAPPPPPHRWYQPDGPAATGSNLIVPDDMDVFFHSMSDATGNAASYYASPAAAAARAMHGYHRPSPHGKLSPRARFAISSHLDPYLTRSSSPISIATAARSRRPSWRQPSVSAALPLAAASVDGAVRGRQAGHGSSPGAPLGAVVALS